MEKPTLIRHKIFFIIIYVLLLLSKEEPMTLQERIDASWEGELDSQAVRDVIAKLDAGELRVAEKIEGTWVVHAWIKKAVSPYLVFSF